MGGDDKVEDMVPALALSVLAAPEVSEEDRALVLVWVLEAVVVLVADRVMAPVEVLVALVEDMVVVLAEVLEVPVLAAYRTDSTENKAADKVVAPALVEVLAALVEGQACAYDRRSCPA